IVAVTLRSREARELGCRPGTAAFRSERISWGGDGPPIVYDRVFIPGDRFWISRELTYEGVRP
ncbi:MAG: UTRA domain-containing protein, partial [candidate division NC10 bacterium]